MRWIKQPWRSDPLAVYCETVIGNYAISQHDGLLQLTFRKSYLEEPIIISETVDILAVLKSKAKHHMSVRLWDTLEKEGGKTPTEVLIENGYMVVSGLEDYTKRSIIKIMTENANPKLIGEYTLEEAVNEFGCLHMFENWFDSENNSRPVLKIAWPSEQKSDTKVIIPDKGWK